MVMDGEDATYALCRPPGHHAYRDMAGGFCFLNNSAIAAAHLRLKHERVVILDVDVHHGNGTQGIFYARPDVYTVSIHADPVAYYPYVWAMRTSAAKARASAPISTSPWRSAPATMATSRRWTLRARRSSPLLPAPSSSPSASMPPSTIR
jgi:acetoin utilization deacetylase AcuC-like enzyme